MENHPEAHSDISDENAPSAPGTLDVPDAPGTAESPFSLEDVEHILVEKYRPKFIAKGGEQIVYDIDGHPDIVAKVFVPSIKQVISWNMRHGEPIDSLSDELRELAGPFLRLENRRYQQLKKFFGPEHVPLQKQYLLQIPITTDILNAIYDDKPPAITDKVWTSITIQERVKALSDPSRLTLMGGYAEKAAS